MNEGKSGVYAFKNLVTGRCYVGSSVNIPSRRRSHMSQLRRGVHKSVKLLRAYAKHGEEALEFVVLELTSSEESVLRAAEQKWMDSLEAVTAGYNTAPVAVNVGRTPKSPLHRQRIGDARRGQKHSAEARALISAKATGRVRAPMSDETKARIGQANRGRVWTSEQRARLSAVRSGVQRGPMPEATKRRIGESKAAKKALQCR